MKGLDELIQDNIILYDILEQVLDKRNKATDVFELNQCIREVDSLINQIRCNNLIIEYYHNAKDNVIKR